MPGAQGCAGAEAQEQAGTGWGLDEVEVGHGASVAELEAIGPATAWVYCTGNKAAGPGAVARLEREADNPAGPGHVASDPWRRGPASRSNAPAESQWAARVGEAVEESLDEQACGELGFSFLTVAIGEGDVLAVVGEDALGAKGGAVNVSSQIFESRLARADGLDIGDPGNGPDDFGDQGQELGVVLLQAA